MSDSSERIRIKPLDDKDDYRLWRIRISAACDSRGIEEVLSSANQHEDATLRAKFAMDQKKASNIVVAALSDKALRVVRSCIGQPNEMLRRLDERYDSKSAATCVTKMTELINLRYDSIKKSMGTHIDQMAATLEQLEGMKTPIPDELSIALLIASIQVPELTAVAAAVKTMSDDSMTWEKVTARLLEEQYSFKGKQKQFERAAPSQNHCELCKKKGHSIKNCWLNPKNPRNRLDISEEGKDPKPSHEKAAPANEKRDKSKKKKRAAVAKALVSKSSLPRVMMLDSGTTTHMTNDVETLQNTALCEVPISLGDDSKIVANYRGSRVVTWQSQDGVTEVRLSGTLAAPDLAMSLLSIPALTEKGFCVLFLPQNAIIMDIEDNLRIVGTAFKDSDGLFYIPTDDKSFHRQVEESEDTIPKSMRAVIRSHAMVTEAEEDLSDDGDVPDRTSEAESESYLASESEEGSEYSGAVELDTLEIQSVDSFGNNESSSLESQGSLSTVAIETWHSRLGHLGSSMDIKRLMDAGILTPVQPGGNNCDPCSKGKFRRFFRGSLTKANAPGYIHADVVGRINPKSHDGYEYFLTIIDEQSRFLDVPLLECKGEASQCLIKFMKRFERQTDVRMKSLHTDGGSEFFRAQKLFAAEGVDVTTSTPYTPASNGLVERTHSTLFSMARTCLVEARLPLHYWSDALRHVVQARNIMIHSSTKESPYVKLFRSNPPYAKHMRPFGCRVLFQPITPKQSKFESRLVEGINLGHVSGGLYKIVTSSKIFVTKHCKFLEHEFPGSCLVNGESRGDISGDGYESSVGIEDTGSTSSSSGYLSLDDDGVASNDSDSVSDEHENGPDDEEQNDIPGETNLDTVTHIPGIPSKFGTDESCAPPDHGYNLRSRANAAIPTSISTDDEPTLKEALASSESEHWKAAIQEEFDTVMQSDTYVHSDTYTGKALPSGIVLRLKRDQEGRPARFKARLVARGNLQPVDENTYEKRYAPVACFDLVRILLALSTSQSWSRHQVDIKGAFLYADLPESDKISLKLPKIDGVRGADGSIVKLQKSLYGLREAPKLWYKTLRTTPKQLGFVAMTCSECLFMLTERGSVVILLVYVDDLGMFGDQKLILRVKQDIKRYFTITDLGKLSHFLGVAINEQKGGSLTLSQRPLIEKFLRHANMLTCKPAASPLPMSHVLYEKRVPVTAEEEDEMQLVPYSSILGTLLHLSTRTRPDLATAVSMLGMFQSSPAPRHWKAMKNVLRYLKGSMDFVLEVKSGSGNRLDAWSDADWARNLEKHRSRSGILLTIGGSSVLWSSKLQPCVAVSTAEAEFYALSECVKAVKWCEQVLRELGFSDKVPVTVYQDNLGTISWTSEVQGLRNVKHVGIRYAFVREAVESKKIEILYTPSSENKADSFTKPLVGFSFRSHLKMIGMIPIPSPGGVSK